MFGTYLCTSNAVIPLNQSNPLLGILPAGTQQLVQQFAFAGGNVTSPPCKEQAPLGDLVGQSGKYPHVTRDP